MVVEIHDPADLAAARELQRRVLRPNGPVPSDTEPPRDALVVWEPGKGAATVLPRAWPAAAPEVPDPPDWQMRSVAVLPEEQNHGVGTALVRDALAAAHARGARGVWAEARVAALRWYLDLGWAVVGPEWDKPQVGPHRWIHIRLSDGLPA